MQSPDAQKLALLAESRASATAATAARTASVSSKSVVPSTIAEMAVLICEMGAVRSLRLLLDERAKGAIDLDVRARDKRGKTPRDVAIENGHQELAAALEEIDGAPAADVRLS